MRAKIYLCLDEALQTGEPGEGGGANHPETRYIQALLSLVEIIENRPMRAEPGSISLPGRACQAATPRGGRVTRQQVTE